MYRNYLKRPLDLLLSLIAFIISLPVFIIIFLILLCQNKGRPLFIQPRPGLNKDFFFVIKFKTMTDKKDDNGNNLPDHQRLTKFGKAIRSTSLDEIPQLINVIKGDMSLIGPRPLLIEYLPLYNKKQARRHEVRPGLTGWAQVNGRNTISWKEKFDFDVWYVDNISFLLDLKILWLTVLKVIKREGINSTDLDTMKPFTGEE